MVLLWAVLMGALSWTVKKNFRSALVLGICVLSHWLLDLVVHFRDLPIYPGDPSKYGLGLWSSKAGTAAVEGVIFILGLVFYLRCTKAKNNWGKLGIWIIVMLLVLIHLANIFGPPPTSVRAIAWGAQLQWIFVLLAYWVDYNRTPAASLPRTA